MGTQRTLGSPILRTPTRNLTPTNTHYALLSILYSPLSPYLIFSLDFNQPTLMPRSLVIYVQIISRNGEQTICRYAYSWLMVIGAHVLCPVTSRLDT